MELREIKLLLALMQDYGLLELELEDKRGKLRLVRGAGDGSIEEKSTDGAARGVRSRPVVVAPQVLSSPAVEARAPRPATSKGIEPQANQKIIASPMVGTFYRAAAPTGEPFVEEGDRVRKGQPLCIIEAMKMMNEIEADVPGQVVKILCENAQPVEFGQPLILLELE